MVTFSPPLAHGVHDSTAATLPAHHADSWDLSRSAPLSSEELNALICAYQGTGCQNSRDRIIESHLRLVAKISRRYQAKGASFDDLMSEGVLAVMRALENFRTDRGVSFTSYAFVAVEHAVRNAARSEGEAVKVPSRERRRAAMRYRAESAFFAQHGRKPAATDLSAMPDAEQAGLSAAPGARPPARSISLDAEQGDQAIRGSSVLAAMDASPAETVEAVDERGALQRAIGELPPAAARVLALRFGLDGSARMSPSQVAKHLGLSPRVVDHLLGDAMRRLRVAVEGNPLAKA